MNEKAAVRENLFGFYLHIGRECGFSHGSRGAVSHVWNREGTWPRYNFGVPDPAHTDRYIREMENGELPAFWIMEDRNEVDFGNLEKKGLRIIRRWTGMALDLAEVRVNGKGKEDWGESAAGMAADRIAGLEIRVNDPDSDGHWLEIVNSTVMSGARIEPEILAGMRSAGTFDRSVAYLEGMPAATGLMYTRDEVAGLYMIATREPFRKMGIGTGVTAGLLKMALRRGLKQVVLHATDQALGLYLRLGFQQVSRFYILWFLGK